MLDIYLLPVPWPITIDQGRSIQETNTEFDTLNVVFMVQQQTSAMQILALTAPSLTQEVVKACRMPPIFPQSFFRSCVLDMLARLPERRRSIIRIEQLP